MASLETKAEHFLEWVNDTYGCTEALAQQLDYTIEMLFYLEEGTFNSKEVREVVCALRGIIIKLRKQN